MRSVKKIYPSWSTLDIQFHVISTLPLPPGPRYFRLLHHTITSREGVCTCQRPWQWHQCTLFTLGTIPAEHNRTMAPWHLTPTPVHIVHTLNSMSSLQHAHCRNWKSLSLTLHRDLLTEYFCWTLLNIASVSQYLLLNVASILHYLLHCLLFVEEMRLHRVCSW